MKDLTGRKIKVMHLASGLDLIGSKSTIHHSKVDMSITDHGVHCLSKGTNREIVIPFDNLKGYELLPKDEAKADSKVKKS